MKIERKFLVEKLNDLLSDEFNPSELVYETDEQLMLRIIQVAEYYMELYNNPEITEFKLFTKN